MGCPRPRAFPSKMTVDDKNHRCDLPGGVIKVLLIVGCLCLLVLVLCGCTDSDSRRVPGLLAATRLSPLPPSATNLAYFQWAGMGTGNTYVRFEVSPSDLYLFLSNSPALHGAKRTRIFDTNHQHLSIPQNSWNSSLPSNHDYYLEGPGDPKWFHPNVLGQGRKYEFNLEYLLWVLFDEENHVIWLLASRG